MLPFWTSRSPAPVPDVDLAELVADEDVLLALNARNQRLSSFWLRDQMGSPPDPRLAGKSVVILDNEDDFVNMLRHVLGVIGLTSTVVRHEDWVPGALDGHDLVIVGPGPGDPRDGDDAKIATGVEVFNLSGAGGTVGLAKLVNEKGNGDLSMRL